MNKYVSIDIGGTAIKYGIIYEDAEIICKRSMKTEAWKGGPAILQKVTGIVEEMKQEAQEEISGICISTAGMVDTKEGSIFYSAPLIPNYAGTQFKKTLEEMFQVPCEVENDVNCAGLAENRSGAAKGAKIALVLTIGTGIGGCIVIDGKVFHGFSNSACEVGYMHMDDSDFQTLGAASILTKKVAEWKGEQEDIWDGYHIFEEAKKGDELCNRAIDEMCDVLGRGISTVCYIINPEIVVLGGGIMEQHHYIMPRIRQSMEKYLMDQITTTSFVASASHGSRAPLLGAFFAFRDRNG